MEGRNLEGMTKRRRKKRQESLSEEAVERKGRKGVWVKRGREEKTGKFRNGTEGRTEEKQMGKKEDGTEIGGGRVSTVGGTRRERGVYEKDQGFHFSSFKV